MARRVEALEQKMRAIDEAAVELTNLVNIMRDGVKPVREMLDRAAERVKELQDAVIALERSVKALEQR